MNAELVAGGYLRVVILTRCFASLQNLHALTLRGLLCTGG